MTRLWSCGFELGTSGKGDFTNLSGTGASYVTAGQRSGNYALRFNPSATSDYPRASHSLNAAVSGAFYFRAYVYIATMPSQLIDLMTIKDSTQTVRYKILLDTDGSLRYYEGGGVGTWATTISSSQPACVTGQWYRMEMQAYAGDSPDTLWFRRDGINLASNHSVAYGDQTYQHVEWGCYPTIVSGTISADIYFDDMAINDNSGTHNTDYPGEGKIVHLYPNAAGDSSSWVATPSQSNYLSVNDNPADDDTSYVASQTANQEDYYNLYSPGLKGNEVVNTVSVSQRSRTVANTSTMTVGVMKQSGGTKSVSGSLDSTSTYTTHNSSSTNNYPLITETDPDGALWTPATLDSMQVGIKLTGVASGPNNTRVTNVWALVDYTPNQVVSSLATTWAVRLRRTNTLVTSYKVYGPVTYGAASSSTGISASAGASSLSVVYPSGIVAHSGLLLCLIQKPTTANGGGVTTPSGWTLVASKTASGGWGTALTSTTGNTNAYVFFKDADGTESGSLTVNLTDSDVAVCKILRFESISGLWSVTGTPGEDVTSGTTFSVSGSADIGLAPGMAIVGLMSIPTNIGAGATFSAESFSATGVTFSGATEVNELVSNIGNDIAGVVFKDYVSTGTSSSAPSMTASVGAGAPTNAMGPGLIVRLASPVAVSSSDTGSAVENGTATESTISKSESDTFAGTDVGALSASLSGSDTSTLVDAQVVTANLTGTETSSGIETVTASSVTISSSDLSSLDDVGVALANPSQTDVSSLVETQSVIVATASNETGSLVDFASVVATVSSLDTSSAITEGVELIFAGVVSVDTAAGIDDQQSSAVAEVPDTSTSVETQSLVVSLTDNDVMALTDTSSFAAGLVEADSFLADETEEVEGGISEYITLDEDWAILSDSSTGDVYSISDSEELSPTDLDGSTFAGIETESLVVSINLDESVGIGEATVVNLVDNDSLTCVEAQDIIFNSFGDDSSSLTVEAEEIHELVFVTDDDPVSSVEDMVLIDAELPLDDDLSNGLDEESTSAILTEYDLFDGLEDELSAGPTGYELIVGTEEAWINVTLSDSDLGFSTDLGIVGQEEADLGTSSELESVSVGLYGNDSFTGLDAPLLTNLDDSDIGASVEDQLLTADFTEDDPATFFEINLTTGISGDDSAVASEDLVIIDLFDADAGVAGEDFVLLEVEIVDQEIALLVDDGSPGNSIGDEGLFLELSGIDATTAGDDTFGYLDLGYVDIPVAEDLVGAELEQLTVFDLELLTGIETAAIELSTSGEANLLVEAESLNSDLTIDDPVISTEAEFLEVLSSETSTGLDIEMAWDAQVYDDDPFLVLDDFTITKVQEHFDDESIDFVESLVDIGLSTLDNGSSTDQIIQLAFTDSDLWFGFDASQISQSAITDLSSTVETEAVVVNLFSGDSASGVESYVETNLIVNDPFGAVDVETVYADSIEFDFITCEEDFVAVDLVDDESLLADETNAELTANVIEDELLLTDEDMVSIEADLATGEDFILFDTQSYFLGDSFTDDESIVNAVEDEQVVWVISDSDDGTGTEAEFKPKTIAQGMGPEGLTIMRRMTISMIKTNPIAIALIPEIKVRKDNGTMSFENGLPRPIQTFMLIPSSYQTKPTQIVDGVERVIDYTLLGRWDAQMERGDHWVGEDGKHYKIIELVPYMPYAYEKKGLVECHG